MIADNLYRDQYLKLITKSRQIYAKSQKEAINASLTAAGKTEWTPKTISVETGYLLAEQVPNIVGMNPSRNYAFKLEVRVPESGKGEVTITITPPQGLVSSLSMEKLATNYLNALDGELSTRNK